MKGLSRPGVAWYRFAVDVPTDWKGESRLEMQYVNDCDETYFDGVKVGATGTETPGYWCAPRSYAVGKVAPKFHPHLFALAGRDEIARWADAELLSDGRVRVICAMVKNPVTVQYCVSGYPPGIAFRRVDDDLPVYPFELPVANVCNAGTQWNRHIKR